MHGDGSEKYPSADVFDAGISCSSKTMLLAFVQDTESQDTKNGMNINRQNVAFKRRKILWII